MERCVLLLKAATPMMDKLHQFVAGSGLMMMLADADHRILKVLGEDNGDAQLAGYLTPGTCSVAPIKDAEGNTVGFLAMTGSQEKVHRHTLGMLAAAACAIENQIAVLAVVDAAQETNQVSQTVNLITRAGAQAGFTFDSFVGQNQEIREVLRLARIAGNSSSNVLIQGESGTGKEILAQAIHNGSARKDAPFVAVNCAAIPRQLIESEMFGYEEGAFTGARRGGRSGKFELANGGTIFLDEIGDMPVDMQMKLLRVIQEQQVERLGGSHHIDINVRVIAATNRDLLAEVQQDHFRRDLYYRLNVLLITVIPLRQRPDDLPLLVEYMINKLNQKLRKTVVGVSPGVLEVFRRYSWPGNVRELENVLERAMNVAQGDLIEPDCLPKGITGKVEPTAASPARQVVVSIGETEKMAIARAMEAMSGNIAGTARALNISRNTLYNKMRKYGL